MAWKCSLVAVALLSLPPSMTDAEVLPRKSSLAAAANGGGGPMGRTRLELKDLVKASELPLLVLGRLEKKEETAKEEEESSRGQGKKEEEEEEPSWEFLSASGKEGEEGGGGGKEPEEKERADTKGADRGSKVNSRWDHGLLPAERHRRPPLPTRRSEKPPIPRRRKPDHFGRRRNNRRRRRERVAGFSLVRASEDAVRGRKGKITFDNVFTDLNGMWNPRASVFACKEPGLYFFSFNAKGEGSDEKDDEDESNGNGWLVTFMLNGVEVVSMGGGGPSPSVASNSVLLALNPRDEVHLELARGRLVEDEEGAGHTGAATFSGYRVGNIDSSDIGGEEDEDEEDDYYDDKREGCRDPLASSSAVESDAQPFKEEDGFLEGRDRIKDRFGGLPLLPRPASEEKEDNFVMLGGGGGEKRRRPGSKYHYSKGRPQWKEDADRWWKNRDRYYTNAYDKRRRPATSNFHQYSSVDGRRRPPWTSSATWSNPTSPSSQRRRFGQWYPMREGDGGTTVTGSNIRTSSRYGDSDPGTVRVYYYKDGAQVRGPERERTQPTEGQSWREGGVRQFELGSEGEGNKENGDKERVEENENGSSFKFVSLWEASRRQSQGEDQEATESERSEKAPKKTNRE